MVKRAATLRLFTDNNIPDSVGSYLRGRGHSVHLMRHHMPHDAPDPVVATAAMADGRVLVSIDKDFNSQRFLQPRFSTLSRMGLSGPAPTLVAALKEHMELIEFQWFRMQRDRAQRMIVHVRLGSIRFITS